MSGTSTKRPLQAALRDAHAFRSLFQSSDYERWEIAGSIRRRKPEVGDVEHVVIPAFGEIEVGGGLFAERKRVNLLWHRLDELVGSGQARKHIYGTTGFRWGERYRGVEWNGHLHEFFSADADNWGPILLIRTGPADFSTRVVTALRDGGMYRQQEGRLICVATREALPVPDERDYLAMAGMAWVEPEKRI